MNQEKSESELSRQLWCVHVLGHDEVHACESLEHAVEKMREINEWATGKITPEDTFKAVVSLWPHSPESHAESLKLDSVDVSASRPNWL